LFCKLFVRRIPCCPIYMSTHFAELICPWIVPWFQALESVKMLLLIVEGGRNPVSCFLVLR
jgi:hypothetical protein